MFDGTESLASFFLRPDTLASCTGLMLFSFMVLGHFQPVALTSLRPRLSEKWKKLRHKKRQHFCRVADCVLADATELLSRQNSARYEAKTLMPLLVDVQKLGLCLLESQKTRHRWFSRRQEIEFEQKLLEITRIQEEIRSIPRSPFSIEEVVAGEFRCIL